jgi:glutathionyl-hydroquinone reductase
VRLWPTLARFDLGYNPLGKISERRLADFPALWGYARDLYHLPAFRETTDFGAFARFGSGPSPSFLNDAPWRIKVDPYRADWDEPHDREQLG